jgi:hypothetical protein
MCSAQYQSTAACIHKRVGPLRRSLGPNGGKWQVSSTGGVEPHWARDGRALYFRNARQLFRAAVEAGAPFVAGPPALVARTQDTGTGSGRSYALAPDGRILFLALLRSATAGKLPVLVTGWEGGLPEVNGLPPRE